MADVSIAKLSLQIAASPAALISGLNAGADKVHAFAGDVVKTLDSVGGRVEKLASTITSPFSAIASVLSGAQGAIKGFFGNIFDRERAGEIGEIRRLADNLGLTTEELTGFQFAAARSGSSAESFARGMHALERQLGGVAIAGEDAMGTLDRFGLDSKELSNLPTAQAIERISTRFRELSSPAEKAALAQTAFGRAGKELMQFLELGPDGLKRMSKEAELLGLSFSKAQALSVGAAAGALARIDAAFEGFRRQMVIELAPIVTELTKNFMSWLESIGGIPGLLQTIKGLVFDVADTILKGVQGVARLIDSLGDVKSFGSGFLSQVTLGLLGDSEEEASKKTTTLADDIGGLIKKLQELRDLKLELPLRKVLEQELNRAFLQLKIADVIRLKKAIDDLDKAGAVTNLGGKIENRATALGAEVQKQTVTKEVELRGIGLSPEDAATKELNRQRVEMENSLGDTKKKFSDADLASIQDEIALTQKLAATKAQIAAAPPGDPFLQQVLKDQADALQTKIDATRAGVDPRVRGDQIKAVEEINKTQAALDGVNDRILKLADVNKKMADQNAFRKLADDAEALKQSLKTPGELLDDQLDKIQKMGRAGLLVGDQFRKAVEKAQVGIPGTGPGALLGGAGLEAGSTEALTAINQLRFGGGTTEKVEDILKEQRELEKKNLDAVNGIKDVLGKVGDDFLKNLIGKPVLPKA